MSSRAWPDSARAIINSALKVRINPSDSSIVPSSATRYSASLLAVRNASSERLRRRVNGVWVPCTPEEWLASLLGPQGTAGADGADGQQGTQGLPGAKGDTGAVGPQGPKGDTGTAGATGAVGPKGDKGDTGATGATGPAGTNGTNGATGAIVENGSSLALVQPSGSTTTYYVFLGANTTETSVQQPSAIAGTVANLYVQLSAAPGTGRTWTATLMKNGVATAATCVVSNTATSCSDTAHPVTIVAGDKLDLREVTSSTSVPDTNIAFSFKVTP